MLNLFGVKSSLLFLKPCHCMYVSKVRKRTHQGPK